MPRVDRSLDERRPFLIDGDELAIGRVPVEPYAEAVMNERLRIGRMVTPYQPELCLGTGPGA